MRVYVTQAMDYLCCMLSFQTTGYDKYAFNSLEIGFVIIFFFCISSRLPRHAYHMRFSVTVQKVRQA